MKIKTKILLVLALVLLQAPLSMIQANPYGESFQQESPVVETESALFRSPSESTLEEVLHKPFRAPNDDGWLIPGGYGDTGNAQKIPVGTGWEILLLAVGFYMLFLYISDRKKSMKQENNNSLNLNGN